MVFVLRKPKLPCIAFAGDQAYAAFKYADLDRIAKAVNGDSFRIHDREGRKFEYMSEHAFVAPAFEISPITKKDLVEKVFDARNMTAADTALRDRNLNNIRLDDLVAKLAAAIKAQASTTRAKSAASSTGGHAATGLTG